MDLVQLLLASILPLLMMRICNLVGVRGVWKCDHVPYSYNCDAEGQTTSVLGVFMNFGDDWVNRTLGLATYGVNVLKLHNVNYANLKKEVLSKWGEHMAFEPHELIKEKRTIEIQPYFAAIVYQTSTTCGYWTHDKNSSVKNGEIEGFIPNAVRVHSKQIIDDPFLLGLLDLTFDTLSVIQVADETYDPDFGTVLNNRSVSRHIPVAYYEGLEADVYMTWTTYEPHRPQQDDDTESLLSLVNSNMVEFNTSGHTGVNWSRYKLTEFGRSKKEYKLTVPPNKKARLLQPILKCLDLMVYGEPFPVYFPMTAHSNDHGGECESPRFQPHCVYSWKDAGPPEVYLNKCKQFYRGVKKTKNDENNNQVELKYGISGPILNKLSEPFRQKFKETMIILDKTDLRPEFKWESLNKSDVWSTNADSGPGKVLPDVKRDGVILEYSSVQQLLGWCRPYIVWTDRVVYGKYGGGECWDATGTSAPCRGSDWKHD